MYMGVTCYVVGRGACVGSFFLSSIASLLFVHLLALLLSSVPYRIVFYTRLSINLFWYSTLSFSFSFLHFHSHVGSAIVFFRSFPSFLPSFSFSFAPYFLHPRPRSTLPPPPPPDPNILRTLLFLPFSFFFIFMVVTSIFLHPHLRPS